MKKIRLQNNVYNTISCEGSMANWEKFWAAGERETDRERMICMYYSFENTDKRLDILSC